MIMFVCLLILSVIRSLLRSCITCIIDFNRMRELLGNIDLHHNLTLSLQLKLRSTSLYVTKFAKRGLIHASNFSTLEVCNLPHV